MKIIIFSDDELFTKVTKDKCKEFDYSTFLVKTLTEMNYMLQAIDINLVMVDCDTFRPESFDILSHIQSIRKNTYCLVIERSQHELDEETLLAQITRQVMLQEMYEYRRFVKDFCDAYWHENIDGVVNHDDEEKLSRSDLYYECCDPVTMDTVLDDNGVKLSDLITVDENGICHYREENDYLVPPGWELGHPRKKKYTEKEIDPNGRKLLQFFKKNEDVPLSIETLCLHMWNEYNTTRRNAIYVYIRKLRIFLDDDLDKPKQLIKTQKGSYMLVKDSFDPFK